MKLELAGVNKAFGDHPVLRDMNLRTGEVRALALIGPSGGGKSTLLRIMGGLLFPDAGEVKVNGEALNFEEAWLHRFRRTVGTVFQAGNLFPHLTALKNVMLPLEKVQGLSPAEAREVADGHLRRLGLDGHADKHPAQLSGGQRQRVAIARAIAIKPRLLLFDEPTSALDPEMTAEVLDVIEELKAEGRDFVIVTHAMAFARRVADEIVLLADGTVAEAGPAARVLNDPQTETARKFLRRVLRY